MKKKKTKQLFKQTIYHIWHTIFKKMKITTCTIY